MTTTTCVAEVVQGRSVPMTEIFTVSIDMTDVIYGPQGVECAMPRGESIVAVIPIDSPVIATATYRDGYLHLFQAGGNELPPDMELAPLGRFVLLTFAV